MVVSCSVMRESPRSGHWQAGGAYASSEILQSNGVGTRRLPLLRIRAVSKGRILLAVVLHEKHTQKTPKHVIDLAKDRRDRWRAE